MTTTAQSRVLPGVPSGGEFTAVGHSDSVPSLEPTPARTGLIVDADTSWMTEEKLAAYHAAVLRLRDAGVEGTITEISTDDAEDFDYVSPEGNEFHLMTTQNSISIFRQDEDHLDDAHLGSSQMGRFGQSTPQSIAEVVGYARTQARIADAWVQSTVLRSNQDFKFYPPVPGENSSGEFVSMIVDTPNGSFEVRTARGTHGVTISPQDSDQILSPRMTQAFLEDVTEHSEADPVEVGPAMTRTIATATGENW